MRAYPFAADLDGDGALDIVCGSEDGKFYFYTGENDANRLKVSDAATLKDSAGSALSVSGYSSPVLADVDGDGIFDLISGDENGNILFFAGLGDQTFQSGKKLLSTPLSGQALPELADMNGDGVLDLLVGSNEGRLLLYYGTGDEKGSVQFQAGDGEELSSACAELGTWLAPRAVDLRCV